MLNTALEDMLSWLPAAEVHFESAQALKDALHESASALRDAHSLLGCGRQSAGSAHSPQQPARDVSAVDAAFELVRSIAGTAADAERELRQALSQLRRARKLETRERSARVHAIQQRQRLMRAEPLAP